MGKARYLALSGCVAAGLGVVPASAATVTFNFGELGASGTGGVVCGSPCIIPGQAEQFFTTGGVTLGAIGYNSSGAVAWVTQKPGVASTGETGLGESNTPPPTPSDRDFEITTSTWLLIDNAAANAAGFHADSLTIESLQTGEGADIFAYTGPLSTLIPADLSLITSLSNPGTGTSAEQTVSVPSAEFYVVQAFKPIGGNPGADVAVETEVLTSVPEPATWAMVLLGFAGLGFAAYRSRRPAISIV